MTVFESALVVATFLCSLVAGFLFAFAVVVMPGIKTLSDGDFVRAFQVIDGVIQRNQPLFILVWVGSALSLLAAAGLGVTELAGAERFLLIVAACAYLFVVQLPTIRINIPLNNGLQALDVKSIDDEALRAARAEFEPRWNWWNNLRTVVACGVTASLLVLVRIC